MTNFLNKKRKNRNLPQKERVTIIGVYQVSRLSFGEKIETSLEHSLKRILRLILGNMIC